MPVRPPKQVAPDMMQEIWDDLGLNSSHEENKQPSPKKQ